MDEHDVTQEERPSGKLDSSQGKKDADKSFQSVLMVSAMSSDSDLQRARLQGNSEYYKKNVLFDTQKESGKTEQPVAKGQEQFPFAANIDNESSSRRESMMSGCKSKPSHYSDNLGSIQGNNQQSLELSPEENPANQSMNDGQQNLPAIAEADDEEKKTESIFHLDHSGCVRDFSHKSVPSLYQQSDNQSMTEFVEIKIIVVGAINVGKTSLILKFVDGRFEQGAHSPTIGVDFKIKNLVNGKTAYKLQIFDTAGQERFGEMTHQYYKNAEGVIVAYDNGDRKSFETVSSLFSSIEKHARRDVFSCLLGLKADLRTEEREVPFEDGYEFAQQYGVQFFEVSSKVNSQVDEAFFHMVEKIAKHKTLLSTKSELTKSGITSHTSAQSSIRLDNRSLFDQADRQSLNGGPRMSVRQQGGGCCGSGSSKPTQATPSSINNYGVTSLRATF